MLRKPSLTPRRRPQPPGTQRRADPRRPRQGSSRRALPHHPRRARHAGRQGPQAAPFALWRQASEVRRSQMSRRHRAERREIIPDAKYGDEVLAKFMNSLMYDGKKSAAEGIIYGAFDTIANKTRQDPLVVFHEALRNVSPSIEVKSRRVGGATYQVPVEVRTDRARALAIRWLITAAREPNEPTMQGRLSGELMDAANNRGSAVKKREDTHKMADSNIAFSHYRW